MSEPYATGPITAHAQTQDPLHPMRNAQYVIAAPTMDIDTCRAAMLPDAKLFVYMDSVGIPARKTPPLSKFYLDLQDAMNFHGTHEAFWCDNFGLPINVWDEQWPIARIKPKNKYADWLVDFIVTSGVLRSFAGIYLDLATKQIPQGIINKLAASGITVTKDDQIGHAHYINRLLSGIRARIEPEYLIIANTAGFTQPALDAITVEVERVPNGPGTPRAEAINACKNQMEHGMQRCTSVLWYADEGAMPNAMKGIWG